MLRHILFDLSLFEGEGDRAESQKGLLWMLEGLTRWNEIYLKAHPETPLLYQSGVKYALPEQMQTGDVSQLAIITSALRKAGVSNPDVDSAIDDIRGMIGGECFRDIPRIIANGGGDCDNFACWRAAELRNMGIPVKPFITWRRRADGGMTYHALVIWESDGGSEDPSLLLGMGGPSREADRQEERRKLAERLDTIKARGKTASSNDIASLVGTLTGKKPVVGHGGGGGGHGGGGGGRWGGGGWRGLPQPWGGYGWGYPVQPIYLDDGVDIDDLEDPDFVSSRGKLASLRDGA